MRLIKASLHDPSRSEYENEIEYEYNFSNLVHSIIKFHTNILSWSATGKSELITNTLSNLLKPELNCL